MYVGWCVKRWRVGFSMRWRPRAGSGDQLVFTYYCCIMHAGWLAGRRALGGIGRWIFVQQPLAAIPSFHSV
jgi:hypothetical protein